jgi:hypothetical protein
MKFDKKYRITVEDLEFLKARKFLQGVREDVVTFIEIYGSEDFDGLDSECYIILREDEIPIAPFEEYFECLKVI